jgi:GAF domain-containing protein/HAMP domain-containing protein
LRIAIVLVLAFLGIFVLYFYLAQTTKNWQLYLLSDVTAFIVLINVLAIRHSLKKRAEPAAFMMVAGIALILPVATSFLSGVGLVLGIGGLISIYMIATLTLVQPQSSIALFVGLVAGVGVILLDAFFPYQRLEIKLLTISIPIIVVAGVAIFVYYLLQEFSNYPFRTKLILFFILVAVFSVVTVAAITNDLARTEITQQAGQSQITRAESLAFETGKELESQINNLQSISSQFGDITAYLNSLYSGTNDSITNQILLRDKKWLSAPDDDSLIYGVLNNPTASKLKFFQQEFPSHVELFLTDKYGANIAATDRTSDYYQADEEWWKSSYDLGHGKVYIGQPEYDESSKTYSIIMAVPVFSNDKVSGILRSTLDVTAILNNLQQASTMQSEEVDLRVSGDKYLDGTPINPNELADLGSVLGTYGTINYKGQPSLASQQRVFSSTNSTSSEAINKLGWSVIVHQDVVDALQPVRQQTQTITLVAVAITILVGLLGFFASQRLAEPIITLTDITGKVAEGDLSIRAKISTQDEIGALANTFNRMTSQLQDTLGGLERRIAERTADVELARLLSERRAQDLQAISELSRTISTEQRLEILLPLVTRLVSERFDFYHVGIFFVDATKQFAILQAANSEGGRRMLARGHRLEVGMTGIVGTVSQTGKPRIALDVGSDATFFDNPDLPETRSEMALPLNFRGETIGVIDVQSVKPGAFTEGDANTLSILADQIAIAIENARLFGQTQQARDEAEALYNQFQKTEWKSFIEQGTTIGYRQSAIGGKPLSEPVETDEIRAAIEKGQVVVFDGKNVKAQPTIAIPVQLRGQTIGVLNIKAPTKSHKWNQDEISLAQAVSDRLALALDNARLLQESQRRASKEAKIGEVTAKIGASINMRNVLQTAVEELGRALPGSEVVIQFESSEEK